MKRTLYLLAALLIFMPACKKKEKETGCTTIDSVCILKLRHRAGPSAFAFNSDYTDDFGNQFQFTRADFYLKVDGFLEHDNLTVTIGDDLYALVSPTIGEINYGVVPEGTLHNLDWAIGVDSALNHADLSIYEAGHALSHQSPSMHWGWSSGYIFCVMEGIVDVDGSGTYDPGENFALHVGMDPQFRDGTNIHVETPVTPGDTAFVNIDVDYLEFVDSIDLSIDNSTHTMDNMPLAVRVADNFPKVLKMP